MPGWLGGGEIMVILVLGLLLFGTTRLPKMARSFRLAIQEFKNVGKEIESELADASAVVKDAKRDVEDSLRA